MEAGRDLQRVLIWGAPCLMLGAARPSLSCIVVEGAPTRIDYSGGNTRAPGIRQDVQHLADRTFSGVQGVSPHPAWSPLTYRYQGQLRMPILIGHANNDPLVSSNQTHTFCPRTSTNCRAEYLDAGGGGAFDFTHADVKNQDLLDFRAKERAWACSVMTRITGRACRWQPSVGASRPLFSIDGCPPLYSPASDS